MKTIIAVFESLNKANEVIEDLIQKDFSLEEVSVITKEIYDNDHDATLNRDIEGVTIGALTGILSYLVPTNIAGLGKLLVSGPIATILNINETTAGGLSGAMVNNGFESEEGSNYEDYINRNYVLVGVTVEDSRIKNANSIFQKQGGIQIKEFSS